jgi:hypothetical protein
MALTGNKDVDYKIMENLNDTDLLSLCQTNKLAKELCNRDDFWHRRAVAKYGPNVSKPNNVSWRDHYKHLMNVYVITYEQDGVKSVIELRRDDQFINETLDLVMEMYEEDSEYNEYPLKPADEVRRIVAQMVGEAIAYAGIWIKTGRMNFDVLSMNDDLFLPAGTNISVLLPTKKSTAPLKRQAPAGLPVYGFPVIPLPNIRSPEYQRAPTVGKRIPSPIIQMPPIPVITSPIMQRHTPSVLPSILSPLPPTPVRVPQKASVPHVPMRATKPTSPRLVPPPEGLPPIPGFHQLPPLPPTPARVPLQKVPSPKKNKFF